MSSSPSDTRASDSGTSDTRASRTRHLTGRRTVAGLFRDRGAAERAIGELKDAGFTGDQIGVVMRDRSEQGDLVEQTGTHAAAGALSGAVGGGILGGVVGFLLGIGALAIPGIGPVVAGGALAAALGIAGGTAAAGAGIGAAAGGLIGALVGMGIPESEARHFEAGVRSGGVLVTVEPRGRLEEAMEILIRHGADTGPDALDAARNATPDAAPAAAPAMAEMREAPTASRVETRNIVVPPAIPAPEAVTDGEDASRDVKMAEEETAQDRTERAIERSFVAAEAESATGGRARAQNAASRTGTSDTGTSDGTYNLMSVVYHALQGVDTYDAYVADAERAGDRELARYFRDVQQENRRRADRAKELLRERLH